MAYQIYPRSVAASNGNGIGDYTDLDPVFGTLVDFAEVHARGTRLVMDLVVNHTPDEHPLVRRVPVVAGQPETRTTVCRHLGPSIVELGDVPLHGGG